MGNLNEIFEAEKNEKYFSEIWAFQTQRAESKNLEKCSKKAVWAAVDYRYQLSETTTCLSSEWIKFMPFSGKKREFSHRLLPNARVT